MTAKYKDETLISVSHKSPMKFLATDQYNRVRFQILEPDGKGVKLHIERLVTELDGITQIPINEPDIEITAEVSVKVSVVRKA